MSQSRKTFIRQAGLAALAPFALAESNPIDYNDFKDQSEPTDEKYWRNIARKYYPVARDYTNLENGYFGVQAKPVLVAFQKNTAFVNTNLARFTRKEYPAVFDGVKKQLGEFLGLPTDEFIITRNATEALNVAIQGYPFKQGDEVLINQLDYFSMIETFRMLEKRGLIKVNSFDMPLLPASEDEIVDMYRSKLTEKTKVILLTHVSNINGLIVPVARISALAKERGIDVMTDSAHAIGQIPFRVRDLGCDFVGMNLHKWIGNPIGAGVLYVKKERITEMKALYGDSSIAETNINKLAHFGTTPMAVMMTIPDSIAFHELMTIERITQRLHYLKSIWLSEFSSHPKIEPVTPSGANFSCAIASFRVKGLDSSEVVKQLWANHKILTVARTLGEAGCVRVTPSLYNSADDMKKFIRVMKELFA